jgi:hypothetical protein
MYASVYPFILVLPELVVSSRLALGGVAASNAEEQNL